MHYTMVEPSCSNFRVITSIFSGVRNFRIIAVDPGSVVFAQTKCQIAVIVIMKRFLI